MAWWNDMLTNAAVRLQVLGRITSRLEQLAKMSFTALGSSDTGIIRIKPDNTGFQRWDGSEWIDVIIDLEKGGTGATTAEAARTALGISSGSGSGTAIGERNFARELTVSADTDNNDSILRVDSENIRFRVASEHYEATIAQVNQSEGSVAFRVIDGSDNEIMVGFIEGVTVTNPSAGVTEVVIEGNQLLGRDLLDRNLTPNIGSLNTTVTLELWRRAVAARDMSLDNAVKLANVDFTTGQITAAWRTALGLGMLATMDGFAYSELDGIPTTFAPSAHQHNADDVNAGVLDSERLPNMAGTFGGITAPAPAATQSYGVQVTDAGVVSLEALAGLAGKGFWSGTQSEYNALAARDSNTIYFILDS